MSGPGSGSDRRTGTLLSLRLWADAMRTSPPLRTVFLVGVAVLCLVVLAAVTAALGLKAREIRDVKRELFNLNTALSEEAGRTVQSVDLVLGSLLELFRADGTLSSVDFPRMRSDRATHDLLRGKTSGLPQLDAITLIGADGTLINFSRSFPIPSVNVADRDYFKALSEADTATPFISAPVENRGTGTWTVYVARRVSAADGGFAGLVLGAIDLRYFEDFYRSLQLGPGSAVTIWRRDGVLLSRYPPLDRIGQQFSNPALAGVTATSPPVVYQNTNSLDGEDRLISRRVVSGYPLVVVVSRTLDSTLGNWRGDTLAVSGAALLGLVAVMTVMAVLARQFMTYEDLAVAVREREDAVEARERVEAQLRQSQKLEFMGQMTSGVAHDFNNLLTVVLGHLDLLGRRASRLEPGTETLLQRHIHGAQDGAERAATLARRLLAFSRREALEPQTVDVNALVAGMADLMRHTLGQPVRLDLRLGAEPAVVFVDASGLEGALLNLVVNARDAMPGGGDLVVETRSDGPHDVALTVADTGTGMAPDVIERAFEPFFTTKAAGLGTGLGLAQVYGFARQSGGEVRIDSETGRGTRITVLLPTSDAAHPTAAHPAVAVAP